MADQKVIDMENSKGIQGDDTSPSNVVSPSTFVPLSQESHSAESSLPSRGPGKQSE